MVSSVKHRLWFRNVCMKCITLSFIHSAGAVLVFKFTVSLSIKILNLIERLYEGSRYIFISSFHICRDGWKLFSKAYDGSATIISARWLDDFPITANLITSTAADYKQNPNVTICFQFIAIYTIINYSSSIKPSDTICVFNVKNNFLLKFASLQ